MGNENSVIANIYMLPKSVLKNEGSGTFLADLNTSVGLRYISGQSLKSSTTPLTTPPTGCVSEMYFKG